MRGLGGRAATLALAAAAVALLAVEPAWAQSSEVGRNVGREVVSWGRSLILGVAALVGIPVLLRQDFAGGLKLLLLVVLVGSFVFAAPEVREMIGSLARAIAP
jgi:hypothetical protein